MGKFGSPIARLVTSMPCDLSSRALALMVRVAEGFMWAILSENCMGLYLGGYMTLSSCSSRLGPVCKLVDMREVERAFFL